MLSGRDIKSNLTRRSGYNYYRFHLLWYGLLLSRCKGHSCQIMPILFLFKVFAYYFSILSVTQIYAGIIYQGLESTGFIFAVFQWICGLPEQWRRYMCSLWNSMISYTLSELSCIYPNKNGFIGAVWVTTDIDLSHHSLLQQQLDDATDRWGVKVERVEM